MRQFILFVCYNYLKRRCYYDILGIVDSYCIPIFKKIADYFQYLSDLGEMSHECKMA